MSKLPLIAVTAALGLAIVAGATSSVTAEEAGPIPPSGYINCYKNGSHCSYAGDNYWSGCATRFAEGWIPTSNAILICTTYHVE